MNINFPRMFSKKKFALKICYLNYKLLYDSLYQNCCTIIFIKSGSARLFQTHIEGNAVTYSTIMRFDASEYRRGMIIVIVVA